MKFQSTISNEVINEMPTGHFSGRILVIHDEATMREAEELLRGQQLLGYDTESRPSFQKGIKHGLALIQIATSEFALLFRVKCIPLSEEVRRILSSPDVLKIGAALRDDLRGMHKVAQFTPKGFVDLQSVVKHWEIEELSVKKMAGIVLGIKVSKAQRLTNWEAVRLTESQQDYAAMDAWVCREIYLRLRKNNPVRMAELKVELSKERIPVKKKKRYKKPGANKTDRYRGERSEPFRADGGRPETETRSFPIVPSKERVAARRETKKKREA